MPVFYLEVPPFLFRTVVAGLASAGLTKNARVVVEKPFGHDLASARTLNDAIHEHIDESHLYRIDHFLGKMGLAEILYLRFANGQYAGYREIDGVAQDSETETYAALRLEI